MGLALVFLTLLSKLFVTDAQRLNALRDYASYELDGFKQIFDDDSTSLAFKPKPFPHYLRFDLNDPSKEPFVSLLRPPQHPKTSDIDPEFDLNYNPGLSITPKRFKPPGLQRSHSILNSPNVPFIRKEFPGFYDYFREGPEFEPSNHPSGNELHPTANPTVTDVEAKHDPDENLAGFKHGSVADYIAIVIDASKTLGQNSGLFAINNVPGFNPSISVITGKSHFARSNDPDNANFPPEDLDSHREKDPGFDPANDDQKDTDSPREIDPGFDPTNHPQKDSDSTQKDLESHNEIDPGVDPGSFLSKNLASQHEIDAGFDPANYPLKDPNGHSEIDPGFDPANYPLKDPNGHSEIDPGFDPANHLQYVPGNLNEESTRTVGKASKPAKQLDPSILINGSEPDTNSGNVLADSSLISEKHLIDLGSDPSKTLITEPGFDPNIPPVDPGVDPTFDPNKVPAVDPSFKDPDKISSVVSGYVPNQVFTDLGLDPTKYRGMFGDSTKPYIIAVILDTDKIANSRNNQQPLQET